jgi:hypothetical protein
MNMPLISTILVGSLSAGIVLFYALSAIEVGSRKLMLNVQNVTVSNELVLEIIHMLKRVVPRFPPLQGVIMLLTLVGLGVQTWQVGWVSLGGVSMVVFLCITAWIVGPRHIKQSVQFLKSSDLTEPIETLRFELGRVVGSHHLALVAYVVCLSLQIGIILTGVIR